MGLYFAYATAFSPFGLSWCRLLTFEEGRVFHFFGSPFGQAFIGASYGAIGAYIAVTMQSRRNARASLALEVSREVLDPEFVQYRRNAARYLIAMNYVGANDKPLKNNISVGFTDLFDETEDDNRNAQIDDLRKVLSRLEWISGLYKSEAVDIAILEQSIGDRIRNWLDVFEAFVEKEEDQEFWKITFESLTKLREAFPKKS